MTRIVLSSLMSLETYHKQRPEFRQKALQHRRNRTVFVGPNVTLQFEDELTIRYQIQEMLRIEKTFDEEGIQDELDAYNPLVPDGSNLKCTMLIEFVDIEERKIALAKMSGVEHRTYIQVAGHDRVYAIADEDLERSNEEKTSAVHFMRFEFTADMVNSFKQGAPIAMGVDHKAYSHRIDEIAPETQGALAADFT